MKKNKVVLICLIIFLAILGLALSSQSIKYLAINKTVDKAPLQDRFFIVNASDSKEVAVKGSIIYVIITILCFLTYFLIIKRSNEFKGIKQVILVIILISSIFAICLPNTTTDVFYYLGTGRLLQKYHQNPYFVTIYEYMSNHEISDCIFENSGVWLDTVVPYGPLFVGISAIVSFLSFGKLTLALYLYKILTIIVHVLCAYTIYKITGKKKLTILYGLNPFLLYEFMINCHNDIFLVFFVLLGFYFLKKKDNIWLALLCLSASILVKYVTLIIAPFMALYYVRKKSYLKKILWCIVYAIYTVAIVLTVYLIAFRGFTQLVAILETQQGRIMNSIYVILYTLGLDNVIDILKSISLTVFIIYIAGVIVVLFFKGKYFRQYMECAEEVLIILIFAVLTNLGFWYLSWLFIPIFWLKSKKINRILFLQFFAEISYFFEFYYLSDAFVIQYLLLPSIVILMIAREFIIKIYNKRRKKIA